MENNTGIDVGDHVRVVGGFENGVTGQVVAVDLSGNIKTHPRFELFVDGTYRRVGGFHAAQLERCDEGVVWDEDHGFWSDGSCSWVATMAAFDGSVCQMRVTDLRSGTVAPGDGFSWRVQRFQRQDPDLPPVVQTGMKPTVVDQGTAHGLRRAQQDAVRAVVWHGGSSNER